QPIWRGGAGSSGGRVRGPLPGEPPTAFEAPSALTIPRAICPSRRSVGELVPFVVAPRLNMTSLLVSTYSAGAPTLLFQNAAEPIPCTLVPRKVTLSLAKAVRIARACWRRSGINA